MVFKAPSLPLTVEKISRDGNEAGGIVQSGKIGCERPDQVGTSKAPAAR